MKKTIVIGVILIAGFWYIGRPVLFQKKEAPVGKSMKLASHAFEHEGKIPVEFTCDGKSTHPPLLISGVPAGTKSLAIIVDDPDAPSGIFTHWVIWNINPDTVNISEGAVPEKSQEGTNSAGQIGFYPPCPPSGTHRYFFTLYALDTKIGLDGKATKTDVEKAIVGHIRARSLLVGVYSR